MLLTFNEIKLLKLGVLTHLRLYQLNQAKYLFSLMPNDTSLWTNDVFCSMIGDYGPITEYYAEKRNLWTNDRMLCPMTVAYGPMTGSYAQWLELMDQWQDLMTITGSYKYAQGQEIMNQWQNIMPKTGTYGPMTGSYWPMTGSYAHDIILWTNDRILCTMIESYGWITEAYGQKSTF